MANEKEPWEKSFEKKMEGFGEEMEGFGKRAESWGRRMESKWYRAFGFFGPLAESVFGIVCLFICAWVLGLIGSASEISFLLAVRGFLLENLGFFFVLALFFNYMEYFSKASREFYHTIYPGVKAAGVVVAVWIISLIVLFPEFPSWLGFLKGPAAFALANLFWLLVLFAAIGYLFTAISLAGGQAKRQRVREEKVMAKEKVKQEGIKRLYRSGKDKILGGVCGGIAEYLNVDPVIIRLIWVAALFLSLFVPAVLLYIIAWIIIPRNPKDRWD